MGLTDKRIRLEVEDNLGNPLHLLRLIYKKKMLRIA
jgi:hypothetical protein